MFLTPKNKLSLYILIFKEAANKRFTFLGLEGKIEELYSLFWGKFILGRLLLNMLNEYPRQLFR